MIKKKKTKEEAIPCLAWGEMSGVID